MKNVTISVPAPAAALLDELEAAGYEAWLVGGCVRDSLLGSTPGDWDVTTSALPEEMQRVFAGRRVIETGLKHGTLTVLADDRMPVEITTYRIDGGYSDARHPDRVSFTRNLHEDLSRRDFTVNALAYHPVRGLRDDFGGLDDLENGVLRCVGDPERRFREDALRMLRALRFSAVLGFSIEAAADAALRALRENLSAVSAERLWNELIRLLCGRQVTRVLLAYPEILAQFIPEIAPMVGFAQNNPYHRYDVYEHTARSVAEVPPDPVVRLAMLFHDIGKPACYTQDEHGIGHFYGHQALSAAMARMILSRLRCDKTTLETVCRLVKWHDVQLVPTPASLRRWLNRLGAQDMYRLLQVKRADILAQTPELRARTEEIAYLTSLVDTILQEQQCFSLRDLAVNGRDLTALGIPPGPALGRLLDTLLGEVIDGTCPNEREALLHRVRCLTH